jgi:uncharacterized protein YaiE (UPF0345 family)
VDARHDIGSRRIRRDVNHDRRKEYFGGKVKSLGFEDSRGKAHRGVMEAGEYEFGTSTPETMKIVAGEMSV